MYHYSLLNPKGALKSRNVYKYAHPQMVVRKYSSKLRNLYEYT